MDVKIGPPKLHRQLLVWQDENNTLIARDSTGDTNHTYRISDIISEDTAKPKPGTPLAAAPDEDAAVHIFYLSDHDNSVVHLVQREAGYWAVQGQANRVASHSSLSAAWHQDVNGSSGIILAYQSPDDDVCFYLAASKASAVINVSDLLHLEIGDWDNLGFAVTSGVQYKGEGEVRGKDELPALYLAVEGSSDVLVAECSIDFESKEDVKGDCYWLETAFSSKFL